MRAAVVQDQVQTQLAGSRLVDLLEKGQEVLGSDLGASRFQVPEVTVGEDGDPGTGESGKAMSGRPGRLGTFLR